MVLTIHLNTPPGDRSRIAKNFRSIRPMGIRASCMTCWGLPSPYLPRGDVELATNFPLREPKNSTYHGSSGASSFAVDHYRCSPGVEKLLGYFLLLEDGSQTMLTPAESEQRFGWKNDPSKVPQLPGM